MSSSPPPTATPRTARRSPIAEAIVGRFDTELHRPLDHGAQQWWHSDGPAAGWWLEPRFRNFDHVYGAGAFTWAGLWTVTDPPPEVHGDLAAAWELDPDPISRWQLPVDPAARVVELHRPQDWVDLVTAHPAPGRPHDSWELPGPNQHVQSLDRLLAEPGQRGARASVRHQLVPDWSAVAAEYDGVHLSWAGFLTTEGYVCDLGDGDVTMLRHWWSERTHWLADVFGEPEPLDAPRFEPDGTALSGVDVRVDAERRQRDRTVLDALLGRAPGGAGRPGRWTRP